MKLFTDGWSRGNPGPAGCGVVIKDNNNVTIKKLFFYLGIWTNNQAEYTALLLWLEEVRKLKNNSPLNCYLDSELIVKQLNKEYKVKDIYLKNIFNKINLILKQIKQVKFIHIPREKNKEADLLANKAMDFKKNEKIPEILEQEETKQQTLF